MLGDKRVQGVILMADMKVHQLNKIKKELVEVINEMNGPEMSRGTTLSIRRSVILSRE